MEKLEEVLDSIYSNFSDEIYDSDIEDDCGGDVESISRSQLRSLPIDLNSSSSRSESDLNSGYCDVRNDSQEDGSCSPGKLSFSAKDLDSSLSVSDTAVESENAAACSNYDEYIHWSPGIKEANDIQSDEDGAEQDTATPVRLRHDDSRRDGPNREALGSKTEQTSTSFDPEPPRKKYKKSDRVHDWTKNIPEERPRMTFVKPPSVATRNQKYSPLTAFLEYFSPDVLRLIVNMTNKNYRRKQSLREESRGASDMKSRHVVWKDTTVSEMKIFIGLLIAMGLDRRPELGMYWRTTCPVLRLPGFAAVMTSNRFLMIHRHLHFSEPEEKTSEQSTSTSQPLVTDKLWKIRTFVELVRQNCLRKYNVGRELAIDESMIPFKGRISFRQFIPSKRTRYGIKVWALAESETSYLANFQIYVGGESIALNEDCAYGLSTAIVLRLIEPYKGNGHHLYMDNFYTSVRLLELLQSDGTYACGTARTTRKGFPKELALTKTGPSKAKRGDMNWLMCGDVLCYSWYDNKPVYLMSTIHRPEVTPGIKVKRRKSTANPDGEIRCPSLIKDYNKYMGAVDSNDQMRKYYHLMRKHNVWYRKIFCYILEISVHNARVLYESSVGKKQNGCRFREELIAALVGEETLRPRTSRILPNEELRLDNSLPHLPTHAADRSRKRCAYCSAQKAAAKPNKEKFNVYQSTSVCNTCRVHLCHNMDRECFRLYHEKASFDP